MTRGAAGSPRVREPRPVQTLRVVPKPVQRASSGAFVLFVAGVLGVGLLGLLALNTLLTQGSFATSELSRRQAALADQQQALQQDVARLESPKNLAATATQLGMVGTRNPVFIDPVTGKVLGVPLAAPRPVVRAAATATPSGTATAAATPSAAATPAAAAKPSATAKPSAGAGG